MTSFGLVHKVCADIYAESANKQTNKQRNAPTDGHTDPQTITHEPKSKRNEAAKVAITRATNNDNNNNRKHYK